MEAIHACQADWQCLLTNEKTRVFNINGTIDLDSTFVHGYFFAFEKLHRKRAGFLLLPDGMRVLLVLTAFHWNGAEEAWCVTFTNKNELGYLCGPLDEEEMDFPHQDAKATFDGEGKFNPEDN